MPRGEMTGSWLWIGATSTFGGPVMIVKVCSVSPVSRPFQRSHNPANAIGKPSARPTALSCLSVGTFRHS